MTILFHHHATCPKIHVEALRVVVYLSTDFKTLGKGTARPASPPSLAANSPLPGIGGKWLIKFVSSARPSPLKAKTISPRTFN